MYKLTPQQRADLEISVKHAKEISTRNRLCAILAYDKGYTMEQIADNLCISVATVSLYISQYHFSGKTENESKGGNKNKLTEEESSALEKHLTEVTYLHVKHIQKYVQKTFGVGFSRSGMTFWLKERKFIHKKPKKVPGKVDPAKQAAFISFYEELKKNMTSSEEIYFGDAVHPEHQSQSVCGWIKKGEEKTIQTTGKQRRLHFAGAISLQSMQVFTQEYSQIDADAMVDFLKKLRVFSSASKIHLVLDNGRAHKNGRVEKVAEELGIIIHYLPPYSPNLNPIERLWKILRENELYNKYYEDWNDFCLAVRGFFTEKIPRMTQKLSTRINDHFQVINLNPVKNVNSFF